MSKAKSQPLSGKISDRIRSKGDDQLPPDVHVLKKLPRHEELPTSDAIRHGGGQGLGQGATRARGGDETR